MQLLWDEYFTYNSNGLSGLRATMAISKKTGRLQTGGGGAPGTSLRANSVLQRCGDGLHVARHGFLGLGFDHDARQLLGP